MSTRTVIHDTFVIERAYPATPTRDRAVHHRQAVVHGRRPHAGTGPSTASTA